METPRKSIIAIKFIITIINLRGVSTTLYFNLKITMQTYKERKLLTNFKLDGAIRLVTRLFQQDWNNNDI